MLLQTENRISMTLVTTTAQLAAIEHPSLMCEVLGDYLAEYISWRLYHKNNQKCRYDEDNNIIGLVTVLRPMLLKTAITFFDLSADEHAQIDAERKRRQEGICSTPNQSGF
jgi:hypothetical protein